ncbi:Polyneuridine-aldehyde esterase [Handroanthus impetiginosus]|uniref:Polyneuridine-aldehyde esterase n=1 Tax=Handroanthus impetiginosus TaxID=429701 RepID=A0A2G9HAA7_9LAMI|nr:Polyneuridine-aldehyde esterase [Handroanthus impetiginosus]
MHDSQHNVSMPWNKKETCIAREMQHNERTPTEARLDTKFSPFGDPEDHLTSVLFGPKFLSKVYNLCPREDLALAKMLVRPTSLFIEDLSKQNPFSEEGFGSVKRVYIMCREDKGIPINFQRWQIENSGVAEVKEIENADHMAMLSTPKELCQFLLEIANNYA